MQQTEMKKSVAKKALEFIKADMILGVGTGSTVDCLIDLLPTVKHLIEAAVPSSKLTEKKLLDKSIPILSLSLVDKLPLYIDGADQVNSLGQMIKGGGGALTREKILATASDDFICIVDEKKTHKPFGHFPLPVEILEQARSYVSHQMLKMGGRPVLRENFVTDNGHLILDIHGLNLEKPIELEKQLNQIPGVVCHGLFAHRCADKVILGRKDGSVDIRKIA